MVTDLIISWPNNCDYPLWRQFLKENRHYFNEVIIAITESHQQQNYEAILREDLIPYHVQFVNPPQTPPGEDWRHIAVTQSLIHSYNAPWIWFTEQDYLINNPNEYFLELDDAVNQG
jgi:hypothetical protein